MELLNTRQEVYDNLIQPSPLFLKQVVDITETKTYILVRDLRRLKM